MCSSFKLPRLTTSLTPRLQQISIFIQLVDVPIPVADIDVALDIEGDVVHILK